MARALPPVRSHQLMGSSRARTVTTSSRFRQVIFGINRFIADRPPQGAQAAAENRSASLSQAATRFHLGQIWATKFSKSRKRLKRRRLSGSIARNTPSAKPLTSNGFLFRTKPGIEPAVWGRPQVLVLAVADRGTRRSVGVPAHRFDHELLRSPRRRGRCLRHRAVRSVQSK